MKKIILATLSVLYLVSYGQSKKKNDLTEENLKGKVKSIKETTYEAVDKFGQIEKGNVFYDRFSLLFNSPFTIIYNEKGNKIEKNYYNSDGSLKSKTTYKYDKKGNNIEYNICYSDGSLDKTTYKYKYEYDKNNNWTQQVTYENNKPTQITERIIEYYP